MTDPLQAYRLLSRQLLLRADRYSPELTRQAAAAIGELCIRCAGLEADNATLTATIHKLAAEVTAWTFGERGPVPAGGVPAVAIPSCPSCGRTAPVWRDNDAGAWECRTCLVGFRLEPRVECLPTPFLVPGEACPGCGSTATFRELATPWGEARPPSETWWRCRGCGRGSA